MRYWQASNTPEELGDDDRIVPVHGHLVNKPEGDAGIYATVKMIRSIIERYKRYPKMRELSMNIVRNVPEGRMNYAKAIYNWIVANVKYLPDVLDVETLQTPVLTINGRGGDCDDLVILGSVLLETIGIPAVPVLTSYVPSGHFSHIYIYALIDGKKIPFDTAKRRYFGYEQTPYTRKEIVR